jgi:hypothetical protein
LEISTDFSKGQSLSPTDINDVIKLARKAGLTNASKIHTDSFGEISVSSPEMTAGREVSFVSVRVERDGLTEALWMNFTNVFAGKENTG